MIEHLVEDVDGEQLQLRVVLLADFGDGCVDVFRGVAVDERGADTQVLLQFSADELLRIVDDDDERSKREVEAEAVAYIVGRYFGLDTSGLAFYLAAWQDDDTEVVQDRLGRISSTTQEIIGSVAEG